MRRWTVVLISPQESGNVGGAARVLKNFSAGELRIVAPRCEVLCSDSRRFAAGAADVLRRARVFDSLPDALADQELSIGLTGIGGRHHRMDCIDLLPTRLLENKAHLTRCALVFGREDLGMKGDELERCDYLWSLPTNGAFPSLNLAQAVGVALAAASEVERQMGLAATQSHGNMPSAMSLNPLAGGDQSIDQPATDGDLECLAIKLQATMHRVGWREERRVRESLATLRNLLTRGNVTRREIALFHGLCSQVKLALDRPELFPAPPPDEQA